MFFELIIALVAGVFFGIFTGLIPGIHINLVSILLVTISGRLMGFTNYVVLSVFVISMSVTHTFLDVIPSVFLGAPDSAQALNVLPGHRLLLEGKGIEAIRLATIGSLLCLIGTIMLIPLLIIYIPSIYGFVSQFIGWILLAVVIFMILKEKKFTGKLKGAFVFIMSGVLGLIVLVRLPNLSQPLFPMLSGLFGISTLVMSMSNKVEIPEQKLTESVVLKKGELSRVIGAGTFSGSLTAIFPGLGAAQAAILGSQITGKISEFSFIVLVGGINTVNFTFSLATLYAIEKARNGAVVAVMEMVKSIGKEELMLFLFSALAAGGAATFLAMYLAKGFAKAITKISYMKTCIAVIIFITTLVFYFSSWLGLLVLAVSTATGMIPVLWNVKRSHAMGCLMLPVILFFIL